jgi:hypothetical protein
MAEMQDKSCRPVSRRTTILDKARRVSGGAPRAHRWDGRAWNACAQCPDAFFLESLCDAMVALIFLGLKRINT